MSIIIDALKKKSFKPLPDGPGVYFFLAENKDILYIGKATSLRDRVRSYFSIDIATARGPKIVAMLGRAQVVRVQRTDSVLEALLLEAQLIKKYQPPYNTDEKDDKSWNYVVITREKFPRVLLVRERNLQVGQVSPSITPAPSDATHRSTDGEQMGLDSLCSEEMTEQRTKGIQSQLAPEWARALSGFKKTSSADKRYKYIFGPFPSGGALKESLKIVRRIFPYRDQCKPESGKPCFNAQIGLCPGVCAGTVSVREYARTIRHIKLFFEGKKRTLVRKLEREMKAAIGALAFERANELKKTLFALGHIKDVSLLKRDVLRDRVEKVHEKEFRIEAYDAAHLAGKEVVGVMTVVEGGHTNTNEYRKFHIRGGSGNDLASLEQLLRRRLRHTEWRLPDLIVVDGFDLQLGVAREVLGELGFAIPVVGVVKDAAHKPKDILGDPALIAEQREAILLANAEAHRFAIGFHRKTRQKRFLAE